MKRRKYFFAFGRDGFGSSVIKRDKWETILWHLNNLHNGMEKDSQDKWVYEISLKLYEREKDQRREVKGR